MSVLGRDDRCGLSVVFCPPPDRSLERCLTLPSWRAVCTLTSPVLKMAAKGPVVEWTVREQLILASAVQRSGDQNWVSVSRAIKPLVEDARPPDYFSQKNCALQYSAMLDKAKHPKRKRSSDGTPESAATVEEQIVQQLTEKRIKELDSSISETHKEYLALKKEIERIERGDMDAELPAMWEKLQTEIAAKEGADTKGSRTRKTSGTTVPGSDTTEHQKKQKAGSGSAEKHRDKDSHRSPDKRSTQPTPETVTVVPVVKEEKSVPENPTPPVPTSAISPTPSSSSPCTSIPALPVATQRATMLKKRSLETLPLLPSTPGSDVSSLEDSPVLYPMTVPKEEPLRETLAMAGGQLSQSLVLPLSPDMHVIVQQPNIAALPTATPHQPPSKSSDLAVEKKPQLPSGAPTLTAVATAATTATEQKPTITVPEASSGNTQANVSAVKQEASLPVTISPQTPTKVSPEGGPGLATVAMALPQPQPASPLTPPPPPPPVVTPPLTPQHNISGMSLQRSPLSVTRGGQASHQSSQVVVPLPPPPQPQLSPSHIHSPIKRQIQFSPYPQPPPAPPRPVPPPTSPMTVVSTMLSDPRLSSRQGAIRPAAPPPSSAPRVEKDDRKTEQQTPEEDHTGEEDKSQPVNLDVDMETEKQVQNQTMPVSKSSEGGSNVADEEKMESISVDHTLKENDKPFSVEHTYEQKEVMKSQQASPVTQEKTETPVETQESSLSDPNLSSTCQQTTKQKIPDVEAPTSTSSTAKMQVLTDSDDDISKSDVTLSSSTKLSSGSQILFESLPPQPIVELMRQPMKTEMSTHTKPSPPREESSTEGTKQTVLGDIAEEKSSGEEVMPQESKDTSIPKTGEEEVGDREELVDVVNPPLEEKVMETETDGDAPPNSTGKDEELEPSNNKSESCEEGKDVGSTEGQNLDESLQTEGGSSRRSSTSEFPSSPITSVKEETAEPEEIPIRRRGAKHTTGTRKLWATRSRKRKLDAEEGMSTDLESEEEPSSIITSAAPSPAPSQGDGGDGDSGMSKKQWKKAIMLVWRHAAQHKYANLFLHPVRDDDAPGYSDVVHRPMDLSTIKRNIENGVTTNDTEFQRDMLLMFQNAFMYNSSDHDVYEMAEKMRADVMQSIQDYLNTQLQLIVESSTPKVLRSRDKEGRRMEVHDEGLVTPVKKRRTRADDNLL